MFKWRILIVDDEDDIRTIVRASLASKYEIIEARDGLDALEKIELGEPDFVVLDVMMPLMDGFQTCAAIRRHPRYKNLSVLFLSALNSKDDMKKGYGAGANLYLTKPFDPARLLKNVDLFFETNPPPLTKKRYTLEELKALERDGAHAIAQAYSKPVQTATGEVQASARPQAAAAPAPAAPTSNVAAPAPGGRKARVLVVDDDEELRKLLFMTLIDSFEVVTASDGLDAIEKITGYQPDLIVMDAMMPKMSGYQLCQSLRRNARFAKTPMMFVSGKSSPRDQEYALRIGANDFMAKPFEPSALLARLTKLTQQPGFTILPKTLNYDAIVVDENRRKNELEERKDRLHRKEETELEKFLRENT